MPDNTFIDDLLEEKAEEVKRIESSNLMFFDIETGAGNNPKLDQLRIKKIQEDMKAKEYSWRDNWSLETNLKKETEHKQEMAQKAAETGALKLRSEKAKDAVNPYYNRIIIVGWMIDNAVHQFNELGNNEEQMVKYFWERAEGKTLVGFNSEAFDIVTLKIKAAKYGIPVPYHNHVDVFKAVKIWGFSGLTVIGQDELAVVLGLKANTARTHPSKFGELFEMKKMGMPHVTDDDILDIMNKNANDIYQLRDIYMKLKEVRMIN